MDRRAPVQFVCAGGFLPRPRRDFGFGRAIRWPND
nr:MAG TPA: hypothetical protein [Caudoviricetes sp.]